MRILLTNDDGPFSPGLSALGAALERLGEVTVVCPADERSGVSHAISHLAPVGSAPVTLPDGRAAFLLTGTPADCVKFALCELLEEPPDLVVSGLNMGLNAGIDLFYSGTVAAAVEGGLNGVPSVAFATSLDNVHRMPAAADAALSVLGLLLAAELPAPWVFNVNVPALSEGAAPAIRFTSQSTTFPPGRYVRSEGTRRRSRHWLVWEADAGVHPADSDVAALKDGFISVTPLRLDLTNASVLDALAARASIDITNA